MPYIHETEAWGRSLFPPAPIINGIQCLPLSIGHLALLSLKDVFSRLQNIKTAGGALVDGLAICSQLVDDSVLKVNSGTWPEDVKAVGEEVFKHDIEAGIKDFVEYLQESQDVPVYYKKGNGSDSGSDVWMTIKTMLQERLHLSDYDVINRPIAQCIAEHYSIAEREGWLKLQKESEAQFMQSDQFKQDVERALEIAKKVRASNG